jgi:hypothetical protein
MEKFVVLFAGILLLACNNKKLEQKTRREKYNCCDHHQYTAGCQPLKITGFFSAIFDNKITFIIKAEGDSILGRSSLGVMTVLLRDIYLTMAL